MRLRLCAMTLLTPTMRDIGGRPPQARRGLPQLQLTLVPGSYREFVFRSLTLL